MNNRDDLSGERFGHLVAITHIGFNQHGQALWSFICDCGNHRTARGTQARQGKIQDCGCGGRRKNIERLTRHGMYGTRIYNIYYGMMRRCHDPKHVSFPEYGGNGITVCDEWKNSVETFMLWAIDNGYDKSLSIDRIDGTQGYSPNNCRWATHEQQQNNMKSNRHLIHAGRVMTIAQWAREFKVSSQSLATMIKKRGISLAMKHYSLKKGD